MALKWERIGETDYRVPVLGGWLVKCEKKEETQFGLGLGIGLAYVPDPDYKWVEEPYTPRKKIKI